MESNHLGQLQQSASAGIDLSINIYVEQLDVHYYAGNYVMLFCLGGRECCFFFAALWRACSLAALHEIS